MDHPGDRPKFCYAPVLLGFIGRIRSFSHSLKLLVISTSNWSFQSFGPNLCNSTYYYSAFILCSCIIRLVFNSVINLVDRYFCRLALKSFELLLIRPLPFMTFGNSGFRSQSLEIRPTVFIIFESGEWFYRFDHLEFGLLYLNSPSRTRDLLVTLTCFNFTSI